MGLENNLMGALVKIKMKKNIQKATDTSCQIKEGNTESIQSQFQRPYL